MTKLEKTRLMICMAATFFILFGLMTLMLKGFQSAEHHVDDLQVAVDHLIAYCLFLAPFSIALGVAFVDGMDNATWLWKAKNLHEKS